MRFYYGGNNKKAYQNLVNKATFHSLCHYLYQHEAATLRDLKKEISNRDLEKTIEIAIKLRLLERVDRRYYLRFPIFSQKMVTDLEKEETFQEALEILKKEDSQNLFAELNYFNRLLQTTYFYAVHEEIQLADISELKNDEITLISCQLQGDYTTLPYYFTALREDNTITEEFALYDVLGDVDQDYALNQFSYIIQRIHRGKKVRPSIFSQALLITKILSVDTEGVWQLRTPLLKHYEDNSINLAGDSLKWRLLFTKFLEWKRNDSLQYILLKE